MLLQPAGGDNYVDAALIRGLRRAFLGLGLDHRSHLLVDAATAGVAKCMPLGVGCGSDKGKESDDGGTGEHGWKLRRDGKIS